MKRTLSTILFLICILSISAQEPIATTKHEFATANHNQRKILRDSDENLYVVFTDSFGTELIIKGVVYDRMSEEWSDPTPIVKGKNPTLAIDKDDRIHLIFQTTDSNPLLKFQSTENMNEWSEAKILGSSLSNAFPVADCDSSGILNVMWVKDNREGADSLMYCKITNGEIDTIISKASPDRINDISIANHLSNRTNEIYFAYQLGDDSVVFCHTKNYLQDIDTIEVVKGMLPGLTYNSYTVFTDDLGNHTRMLFLEENQSLSEHGLSDLEDSFWENEILHGQIDYFCIDDILPPLGYSFLFIRNDSLFHGFSFGYGSSPILLDTISSYPSFPSMAYKCFNSNYIDFIWMQEGDGRYTIQYKRDDKFDYIHGVNNPDVRESFRISGFPNPFDEILNILVEVAGAEDIPRIDIFDSNARQVAYLQPDDYDGRTFRFVWNVSNTQIVISPGVYFIRCTIGKDRAIKKVIKSE